MNEFVKWQTIYLASIIAIRDALISQTYNPQRGYALRLQL
jgi:hypothetical protein